VARLPPATLLFLPAAAWGGAAIPLWAGGLCPEAPGWHAYGMLQGYALAVVAGFLATRAGRGETLGALAGWLAARIGLCLGGASPPAWALAADAAFALWVVARGAWPLAAGAKRARNRLLGLGAVAVCLSGPALAAALAFGGAGAGTAAVRAVLAAYAFLLAGMGGRALAPALAGERIGGMSGPALRNVVQPRLEAGVLAALAAATALLPWPATRPAGGAALVAAGLLTAARLARWRPWRARRAPVAALAAAYAWLAVALAAWGAAELAGLVPWAAAHLLTVGALGGLTVVMMARTVSLRLGAGPEGFGDMAVALAAVSVAALLRAAGLEMAAAAFWSGGQLLLLRRLAHAVRGAALR